LKKLTKIALSILINSSNYPISKLSEVSYLRSFTDYAIDVASPPPIEFRLSEIKKCMKKGIYMIEKD